MTISRYGIQTFQQVLKKNLEISLCILYYIFRKEISSLFSHNVYYVTFLNRMKHNNMKLIGIEQNSYISKKTNELVVFYSLTFESENNDNTKIGICCSVFRSSYKCLLQAMKAEGAINLDDLLNFDYSYSLDSYRNIVALYRE